MDLKEYNKRVRRTYYINLVFTIIAFILIGYGIIKLI